MASAGGSNDGEQSESTEEENWTNEDGDIEIPESELETWEITVVKEENKEQLTDSERTESTDEADIYVGTNKDSIPPSQRVTVNSSLPPTYLTLASGTLPEDFPQLGGTRWELSGGVRFNAVRLEATVDLTFSIGGADIELWGIGVGPESGRGYCSDVSPGSFPLDVEPCLDLQFGAEELSVGGSIDICTPEVGKYEYCLGAIGFSQSVPVPEEVRNALP